MHAAVASAVAAALLVCCSTQTSSQEIVTLSDQCETAAPDLSSRQADITIAEEARNPWSWDGIKEKSTNMISDLDPKEKILKLLKQWEDGFIKVATPELIKIAKDRQEYWKSLEKSFEKRAAQDQHDNVKNATNENTQEEEKEHNIQRRKGVTDEIDDTNMNVGQHGLHNLLRRRGGMHETDARNIEVGPRRPQNLLRWQGGIDEIDATKMDIGQRRFTNNDVGQRRFQAMFHNLQ